MLTDRILRVTHATTYTYDTPVLRSVHQGHLRPFHDRWQSLLGHSVGITADDSREADVSEFEDAFGNNALTFTVEGPYRKLVVKSTSRVGVPDYDPFAFEFAHKRPTMPLNWMPRERLALLPYLQSLELPDTQVEELFDYAMSFVRANNNDLMEALFAINLHLFNAYEYVTGSTSNATTPYEVYANKKGVCQDFAGLFITLARLIRVPARYVCGYLYTGNEPADAGRGSLTPGGSRAPSDATHAWVQLYIPTVGWKSFDPTNGVLPRLDHVRLSVGRHWQDTSPVHGTLYGEKVKETLHAAVTVEDVTDESRP